MGMDKAEWKGICAIDCETTGLQPYLQEVVEVAIVPLHADFTINADIEPFVTPVKPEHFDTITQQALDVNGKTVEQLETFPTRIETVRSFVKWYEENVGKRQLKNIVPLGHNFGGFDKPFISAWLDPASKHGNVFSAFFHYHYHDSMIAAMYINARQEVKFPGSKPAFYSISLGAVCKRLGIVNDQAHTAYGDAIAAAEVYRKLCEL
jgi:DNA polymerase III epsilon subunit-like protein